MANAASEARKRAPLTTSFLSFSLPSSASEIRHPSLERSQVPKGRKSWDIQEKHPKRIHCLGKFLFGGCLSVLP